MTKQASLFFIMAFFLCSCNNVYLKSLSKDEYVVSRDQGHEGNAKILRGSITRSTLESDTAFKWFADTYKYSNPDASAVAAFAKNKDKFSVIVFGGTWCHDTQNLLPLFYKLTDKSNFPKEKIYLIGMDRAKTTFKDLHTKFNITNVPTFIIRDNAGKEVGRVVEYGKTGLMDKELGEIVSKIQ
jgi:thiol-disulfide isomerase/thioredoxin